jgi:2-polyprenyl-6-methoxyphenol hydroxylase-like FAD-dependent oxidoreductase
MKDLNTTVLIVGGGPVGLTLSLVFARFGVNCMVVERNASTTQHPKMDLTNGRSMEIFRMLGVADKVYELGVSGDICHDVSWVTSLTDHQICRFEYPGPDEARAQYKKLNDGTQPMDPAVRISQIIVEPLLRDEAMTSPRITLRYGWKFIELTQDEDSVTAIIENSVTGEREEVRSSYLAGCDGGNSRVRQGLGIGLSGDAKIRKRYSIHFRSDDKATFEPWGAAWHFQSPIHGTLVNQNGKDRYTLHSFLTEDEDADTVDPYDKVRPFVGKDFHFELLQAINWDNNLLVADGYRDRRVILAGDSTHQYIPTGGYGMNTGVGDAFDLGWKLSALLNGWGGERLLDAIEEERRPIALRNREGSKRHAEARVAIGKIWPDDIDEDGPKGDARRAVLAQKIIEIGNAENESLGIEIGYSYAGSSIVCNEPGDEHQDDPLVYQPTTTPGYRPAAVYLADGQPLFDMFGPEFTLLNFEPDTIDCREIERCATSIGLPLKIGSVTDDHVKSLYQYNLILIRPDQHVAWRGQQVPDNIEEILMKVAGRLPSRL